MNNMQKQLAKREYGDKGAGLLSACTASPHVIRAAMRRFKAAGLPLPLLVESTANQVDQFGGYSGMKPADFVAFVQGLAAQEGYPLDALALGGDHLGPLTWRGEDEVAAMEKACALVEAYVAAGYAKIHIDTSMKLAGDPEGPLDSRVVARRGARLAAVCEAAFEARKRAHPDAEHPIYVVGSEVPVPGGTQEAERVQVTRPADFEATYVQFCEAFEAAGVKEAAQYIVAVVVQPGVEFSGDDICDYAPKEATALMAALEGHPSLVFEGHSTDYQRRDALARLVGDGVAILKVGPGLTFALREGLMALEGMEAQWVPEGRRSHFARVLEDAMLENPAHWQPYCGGDTEAERRVQMLYGYSDRCRYYLGRPEVEGAIATLLDNLAQNPAPLPLVSQYLPVQYGRVRAGALKNTPLDLLYDKIGEVLDDYLFAVGGGAK